MKKKCFQKILSIALLLVFGFQGLGYSQSGVDSTTLLVPTEDSLGSEATIFEEVVVPISPEHQAQALFDDSVAALKVYKRCVKSAFASPDKVVVNVGKEIDSVSYLAGTGFGISALYWFSVYAKSASKTGLVMKYIDLNHELGLLQKSLENTNPRLKGGVQSSIEKLEKKIASLKTTLTKKDAHIVKVLQTSETATEELVKYLEKNKKSTWAIDRIPTYFTKPVMKILMGLVLVASVWASVYEGIEIYKRKSGKTQAIKVLENNFEQSATFAFSTDNQDLKFSELVGDGFRKVMLSQSQGYYSGKDHFGLKCAMYRMLKDQAIDKAQCQLTRDEKSKLKIVNDVDLDTFLSSCFAIGK